MRDEFFQDFNILLYTCTSTLKSKLFLALPWYVTIPIYTLTFQHIPYLLQHSACL